MTLLISGAVVIVVVLAAVAGYYQFKVHALNKKRAQQQAELEQASADKKLKLKDDIVFIARAYLADQVELPEASLRISKLADVIEVPLDERGHYQVFDRVAKQIEGIPTHEEWKALDKKVRKSHEKLLFSLSSKHGDEARAAAQAISDAAHPTLH